MTTKRELREALQRLLDKLDGCDEFVPGPSGQQCCGEIATRVMYCMGGETMWRCASHGRSKRYTDAPAAKAIRAARAILARPAVVTGWRLRYSTNRVTGPVPTTWRISDTSPPAVTLAMARNTQLVRGGKLYRLVRR